MFGRQNVCIGGFHHPKPLPHESFTHNRLSHAQLSPGHPLYLLCHHGRSQRHTPGGTPSQPTNPSTPPNQGMTSDPLPLWPSIAQNLLLVCCSLSHTCSLLHFSHAKHKSGRRAFFSLFSNLLYLLSFSFSFSRVFGKHGAEERNRTETEAKGWHKAFLPTPLL